MTEPARRSGRSRKANTRYSGETWSKETLRLLRESSESSNPTSVDSDQGDNDEEFDDQASRAASPEAADDNLSTHSGSSKSSHVRTPAHEVVADDREIEISSEDEGNKAARVGRAPKPKAPTDQHSRGLSAVERGRSNKQGVWHAMFGPEVEDVMPMLDSKELWVYTARDATLPSRISMDLARERGWLRKHKADSKHSSQPASAINRELLESQRLHQISLQEAKSRCFYVDGLDHQIILGPWSNQQSYDLPFMKSISLGQAWKQGLSSYHSGWLINVGEKPQCMAWSPYDGSEQYLALACRSTQQQRATVQAPEINTAPAFYPSSPYPLGIQIWKFATFNDEPGISFMDFNSTPRLCQILACNFGDVKQMAWLPKASAMSDTQAEADLGTIALLTSDGCLHLVHIPGDDSSLIEPMCLEVVAPMLTIEPPNQSVFTCFDFASPTDVILGTASGYIHIYNISNLPAPDHKWEPYYSLSLHYTYVMSLCVLEEEEYSHFVASCSASGVLQIIDLRSPDQDKLTLPRARIPTRNLVYNRHSRCFITTIDASGNTEPRGNAQTTLSAHNLRHFYATTSLSKFAEGSGIATALASSRLHPFILMGNTCGEVWSQNVIRRVVPTGRGSSSDAGAWVQKVVEYEWIPKPQTATSSEQKAKPDFYNGPPVRPGISRMHFGFRPEKLDLSNTGSKKRKAPASGPNGETAIQVVYEEEQAVANIAWNNNSSVAGWCSIGWNSGVVLVTDLGHDAK